MPACASRPCPLLSRPCDVARLPGAEPVHPHFCSTNEGASGRSARHSKPWAAVTTSRKPSWVMGEGRRAAQGQAEAVTRQPARASAQRVQPHTLCVPAPLPALLHRTSIAQSEVGTAWLPGTMGGGRPPACPASAVLRSAPSPREGVRWGSGRGATTSSTARATTPASSSARLPCPSSPGCVLRGWGRGRQVDCAGAAQRTAHGSAHTPSLHLPSTALSTSPSLHLSRYQ